ncbi:MAG TPA: YitT family protein [Treponemataceae bacterium]|nr:YitT family protein [Treponemataceae bacterium]
MTHNIKISKKLLLKQYFLAVIGSIIYAAAFNIFIRPLNGYSGGFLGVAQVIMTIVKRTTGFETDILGLVMFFLNIPLILITHKTLNRRFVTKTFVSVVIQTAVFVAVPIPTISLLRDPLTAVLMGGFVCGFGCGLVLRAGSSGGGSDIIGMYLIHKNPNYTVGKIALAINAVVFAFCFIFFNFETTVYSILFSTLSIFVMDKVHYQNRKTKVLIISKSKEIPSFILNTMGRGTTEWSAKGSYTGTDTNIYMSVASKYQLPTLKRGVKRIDPNSFVIVTNDISLQGLYRNDLI